MASAYAIPVPPACFFGGFQLFFGAFLEGEIFYGISEKNHGFTRVPQATVHGMGPEIFGSIAAGMGSRGHFSQLPLGRV